MTPREILIAARALIAQPENWTKGAFALTSTGSLGRPGHEESTCFCVAGAILHTQPSTSVRQILKLIEKVLPGEFESVPDFNDDPHTTHADVLAAFDRAIESLDEPAA